MFRLPALTAPTLAYVPTASLPPDASDSQSEKTRPFKTGGRT